jgi:zinc protease
MWSFTIYLFLSTHIFGQGEPIPSINAEQYTLKNGLTVVLHPDHSTPIVAVDVMYKVGSMDELPARTGLAHLFEHLMHTGSKNFPSRYGGQFLGGPGGSANTNRDFTNYLSIVAPNYLERLLFTHADRMDGLLEALDQQKLENQRDVVRNERRQFDDNTAYGTMRERIDSIIYPAGHPYHHPIIGSMDDLARASLQDAHDFYRKFYLPNNAVLVVAGDFDSKQTEAWIQKYFGKIKSGPANTRPRRLQPELREQIHKTYEDPFAAAPRIAMVWPTDNMYSADEAPLSVLATILSYDNDSRLISTVDVKEELVNDIRAWAASDQLAGSFQITATAAPGKSLDDIEKAINRELERVKTEGVTRDEVNRAIRQQEVRTILGLQTVGNKSALLARYSAFTGQANFFQKDIDRFRHVTPDDIRRVAKRYFTQKYLAMSYVPAKTRAASPRVDPPANIEPPEEDAAARAKIEAGLPKVGPDPKFSLPPVEKTRLSNGLKVWIVEHHELPIVTMTMVFNAGGSMDDADKSGLASIAGLMLASGTTSRAGSEVSQGLQSVGAQFDSDNASWDSNFAWLLVPKGGFATALEFYADMITRPSIPDAEFRGMKRALISGARQRRNNPLQLSAMTLNKLVYGKHPYGRSIFGNEKTLGAIDRDDVVRFHNDYYVPNNATLLVVGDVAPADIKLRLEKAFADWKPKALPVHKEENLAPTTGPAIHIIDRPGAVQSSIAMGHVGTDRNNPDHDALELMNAVLSQRITRNLRQIHGFAYSASSAFAFRKGPGPFTATAGVQIGSTKEAVQEFIRELNGIRGARPATADDLARQKQNLMRALARDAETVSGLSNRLIDLAVYGLPTTYFADLSLHLNKVTLEDIHRVANSYIDPTKMVIVVVGDRTVIEPQLKELGMPIFLIDANGESIR